MLTILRGGFNYSSISNMDTNNKLSELNLGFYFDIKIKEQWYLNTIIPIEEDLQKYYDLMLTEILENK